MGQRVSELSKFLESLGIRTVSFRDESLIEWLQFLQVEHPFLASEIQKSMGLQLEDLQKVEQERAQNYQSVRLQRRFLHRDESYDGEAE